MRKAFILTLIISFSFPLINLHAQISNAQGSVTSVISGGISLILTPNTPDPNQLVTARLESSTIDIDSSSITWSQNGSVLRKGTGLKTFSFTTGNIGTSITISATITSDKGIFRKTAVLEIGSVDLLWQGSGYTPPFYKGRTLWGNQTSLKLLAIPNVKNTSGSNLVYQWSLDDKILGDSSGSDKNNLIFSDSILGLPRTVSVGIYKNGELSAKNTLVLRPIQPSVNVYENSGLYGIRFENQLRENIVLGEGEKSFTAFPMFFSFSRLSGSIKYLWQSTGGADQTTNTVTYKTPIGVSGVSSVKIRATNINRILQDASDNLTVKFGKENNL